MLIGKKIKRISKNLKENNKLLFMGNQQETKLIYSLLIRVILKVGSSETTRNCRKIHFFYMI